MSVLLSTIKKVKEDVEEESLGDKPDGEDDTTGLDQSPNDPRPRC